MSEYKTTCWGQDFTISGNFAEASSPVEFDGRGTQYQVADFCHNPAGAMRRYLESVVQDGGDDPESAEAVAAIDEAVENMD